jgi:hypothetical protein
VQVPAIYGSARLLPPDSRLQDKIAPRFLIHSYNEEMNYENLARYNSFGGGHNPTTASRVTDLPISSASTCRLIFMEAVRGKSFSQIK